MRSLLARVLRDRATVIEVAGLGSIAAGLWIVFPPAALIVTGLALVLWAQGHRARSE